MAKNNSYEGRGPSQRQLRVGELVRRSLADALLRGDVHDPELAHVSVSIGEVRMAYDLRRATVFALPLGGVNTDEVIEALNRNKAELRRAVNKALSLKFSPELNFLPDLSFDQMDETKRLLDSPEVRRDLDYEEDE